MKTVMDIVNEYWANLPGYSKCQKEFRAYGRHAQSKVSDRKRLRKKAIDSASRELYEISKDEVTAYVRVPETDIACTCALLLDRRFEFVEIGVIYQRLYRGGRLMRYGKKDFDWSINSHEYPIHVFADTIARSLLFVHPINPSWEFIIKLDDKVAVPSMLRAAGEYGVHFGFVQHVFKSGPFAIEPWKSILFEQLMLEHGQSPPSKQEPNSLLTEPRNPTECKVQLMASHLSQSILARSCVRTKKKHDERQDWGWLKEEHAEFVASDLQALVYSMFS
jgi:hypothetical protein